MNNLITLVLFSLAFYSVNSQSVTLRVIDSVSELPVSYATVYFASDNTGTYTNQDGIFKSDKSNRKTQISHIAYETKTFMLPRFDSTIMLRPRAQLIDEITITPQEVKYETTGYFDYKSDFSKTGFSGDELAVFISNPYHSEKKIKNLIIGFDTRQLVKKDLGVDFVSVFRINLYTKYEDSPEPGKLILTQNDLIFNSDILKRKTKIDLSGFDLKFYEEGIFIAIEWIGIENGETKELITDYKGLTEPFVSNTYKETDALVYERNKFKDMRWTVIDKNSKYSIAFKLDTYFTPRFSVVTY
jgi:hypothetical protein